MPFGYALHAVRALSIALSATLAGGCAFGVGPMLGVSKQGLTVGVRGGGGPGARWGGVRADAGLIVVPGEDGGAWLLAGATGFLVPNPDSHYTGGAYAAIAGSYGGVIYDAGAIGVRFRHPPREMDCSGSGWAVAVGVRRLPDRIELFVWPQYVAYDSSEC
jgi:hypothetical protein